MAVSQVLVRHLVLVLIFAVTLLESADPDPLQDYCLLPQSVKDHQCQKSVTSSDFVSKILRDIRNTQPPKAWNATLVSADNFPALNTMGLSLARAYLGLGGTVPLHQHQRSSELVFVLDGSVEVGFVDSNNVVFAQTLEVGDMMIIPKGVLHYQYNSGTKPATLVATFDSQSPGLLVTGPNLFGSGIRDEVLAASLGGLDFGTVEALKAKNKPRS